MSGTRTLIAISDSDFPESKLEETLITQAGFEFCALDCTGEDELIEKITASQAQGIITSYGPFTRRVLAALAGQVKVIGRTGTGVDNIDLAAATDHGIAVCNVPGYGTEPVSDHALALALCALRRVVDFDRDIRQGIWSFHVQRPLQQINGKVFGVIGMGDIGRAVAKKAKGLGFEVVCWSRRLTPGSSTPDGFAVLELDELIASSDIISLHVALTSQTKHLINKKRLALMKPEAILVNTSRGAVVDTVALAQALTAGQLYGAGIDVFEQEPLSMDHPLLAAPHAILTPHAAYWSEQSGRELRGRCTQQVIDVLRGQTPESCLNPEVL